MLFRATILFTLTALPPLFSASIAEDPKVTPTDLPAAVDLRPEFKRLGLTQRRQGARGTCSVFATVEAVEFAQAKVSGKGVTMSVEFANWAANEATGRTDDGDFFRNIIEGVRKHGICPETAMPYQKGFSAATSPSEDAAVLAAEFLKKNRLEFHWLKDWQRKPGLTDADVQNVKAVLASGYPVSAGSYHSILFVGYQDDAELPGGGRFPISDSNLVEREISYEGAKERFCDMFWVRAEPVKTTADEVVE
jgi:C1A family cysteine protease